MTSDAAERDVAVVVRRLVALRVPGQNAASVSDDTLLGAQGLGLDSITVVEVMLECETACRVVLPRELLAGAPLTVGGLITAVRAARDSRVDA